MTQNDQTQIDGTIEDIYDSFEAAWASGPTPRIDDYLPCGEPLERQRQVLLELVLIDLDHRWQRFHQTDDETTLADSDVSSGHEGIPQCPLLEDYCRQYPELPAVGQLPIEAIAHEFQARCRAGTSPTLDEYARRFPARGAELTPLFAPLESTPHASTADT